LQIECPQTNVHGLSLPRNSKHDKHDRVCSIWVHPYFILSTAFSIPTTFLVKASFFRFSCINFVSAIKQLSLNSVAKAFALFVSYSDYLYFSSAAWSLVFALPSYADISIPSSRIFYIILSRSVSCNLRPIISPSLPLLFILYPSSSACTR